MVKKKQKNKKTKSVGGWILLLLLLVASNVATFGYFLYLSPSVPVSDVPMEIDDITENKGDYLGKILSISGYFIKAANNSLLVKNPLYFFNNSLDSGNNIQILGNVPESMSQYLGMPITIKGSLQDADSSDGSLGIEYGSFIAKESDLLFPGIYNDIQLNPYTEFEISPLILDIPEKFAVLYSGGINPDKAYSRYWNDIIYMYFILLMHGYPTENIYVVYKDGVGEDDYTPVDYPATHDSMNTVFGILSERMGRADDLFFYTTNHGGSGGISVWNPMDSSGALTHNQVSTWLDSILCDQMIIVMEQCVSGKFIPYLSAPNRVIMTACSDGESSWACDYEGSWDEFVYHFMCAVVEFHWNGDGTVLNSDFNKDGRVSMSEAFIFAAAMDSRDETPLYNANGDGVGKNIAEVIYSLGCSPANDVFL